MLENFRVLFKQSCFKIFLENLRSSYREIANLQNDLH